LKTFLQFILSLAALPLLIPWYLSEKIFEYLLQPVLFRKYHVGIDKRPRWVLWLPAALLAAALLFYLAKTFHAFFRYQGSVLAAFSNLMVLPKMIFNGIVPALNLLLWPVNIVLAFTQGVEVGWLRLIGALYLLFLPLIFISDIGFRFFSTTRSLRRAIRLRNEAVRDVNIVRFAETARDDEIFFGIDLSRNGTPFYAKRKWLQGHVQVIGSPGSGKSESIIQPLWFQAVRRNVPTMVLDGKASRQNIDKFYTIASSLAQGHEIIYFNPTDPDRSATYNPLLRGSVTEIKNRILTGLSGARLSATSRERLDYYLNLILRAIKETNAVLTLHELGQYFESKTHVHNQLRKINDTHVHAGLSELLDNYQAFQTETAFLGTLLREICQSEYDWLLDTAEPELDIFEVYTGRKDCYFTLPIAPDDTAMIFLGQLILGDILTTFHHLGLKRDSNGSEGRIDDGLLIIDEVAKFVNPHFIDLLRASRNLGVSVCYTNQSLGELENPELHLTKAFVEQLADHTNVICCFHLGSPESIEAIINRIGPERKTEEPNTAAKAKKGEAKPAAKDIYVVDPNFLKNLEVGRCIAFVRQPRVLGILKTGYFKFDQLLPYARREVEEKSMQP
jgi:hypothetical protein